MSPSSLADACAKFANELTRNFGSTDVNPAQPEDQLKGPTQTLLKEAGGAAGFDVVARTEAQPPEFKVRPDIGVSVNHLLTGHIELKAPGKGARPGRFTGHDKEQWQKFKNHPNLVYTDGNEWALYREGELRGRVLRLAGDVTQDGASAFSERNTLALEALLRDFFGWQPLVPSNPKSLARMLAPLCRLLREEALQAVAREGSALAVLAGEWRQYLFPDADDFQFADAYAQTVTYALLLARFEGETDLHFRAAERLDERHGLLAQVLRILEYPEARQEVEVPVELLERSIGAVEFETLQRRGKGEDPWLYFYEDFLAAYDPRLRRNRGVYYTPWEVVQCQVRLVAEILSNQFGKSLAFADDNVVVLDPAIGTGTYLLAAMQQGLDAVREQYGEGAVGSRATAAAANFHAFELLIGPYAVAHLRLAQQVLQAGGELPIDGVQVYLTDTLDSPHSAPSGQQRMDLTHRKLTEEHERARRVKAETRVLVCIGNPPYFRDTIEPGDSGRARQGAWVRFGDHGDDGILGDFLEGVPGVHAKNLYNLYVYFWRWALWKVFDSTGGDGVVSFITASSYLRGPGFVGMRRKLRQTFDELWLVDLEGDNLGARKTENVFDIQTPVAIAVGVRSEDPDPDTPARVHYTRLTGTEAEKKATLASVDSFASLEWQDCFDGWEEPLLPEGSGDYFAYPLVTDVFPWQHSGAQYKRTWPIAPTKEVLAARWTGLVEAPLPNRAALFHESRDRKVGHEYGRMDGGERLPSLASLKSNSPPPEAVQYGYRSFDRQWALADGRLGDFLRPSLWTTWGPRQVFLTSLLTGVLGSGPAATVTANVPDLHHFRGSFGGADAIPLWRDRDASDPNITKGLLDLLSTQFDTAVNAEDVFAYAYGVLASSDYVQRFSEELLVPGPRLPLTKNPDLFRVMTDMGRQLVWLHTFGQRMALPGESVLPHGVARCTQPVSGSVDGYPAGYSYAESSQELSVGTGAFSPVTPSVWTFSVSGLHVLGSWLDYRMKDGAGRRSSPLDEIRPTTWPAEFTEELLRVVWVLERTVDLMPRANELLAEVCATDAFSADELPTPSEDERKPPAVTANEQPALGLN